MATVRWVRTHAYGWSSPERLQRNLYAWRVTLALTGGEHVCPSCERPIALDGNSDVDRTVSVNDEVGCHYFPTMCAYVCKPCNSDRAKLQNSGSDWRNVSAWIERVATASEGIEIPTIREAREWWPTRPRDLDDPYKPRYA